MTDKYGDYYDYYDSESQAALGLAAWEHARQESYLRRHFPNDPSKWRADVYGEPTQKTSTEHPLTLKEAIYSVLFWIVALNVGFTHGLWWALAASSLVIVFGLLAGVCDETQKDGALNSRLGSFGLCVLGACFAVIAWVFFGDAIAAFGHAIATIFANILYAIAVAVRG